MIVELVESHLKSVTNETGLTKAKNMCKVDFETNIMRDTN